MTMSEDLIKSLVAQHKPVAPFSAKPGVFFAVIATAFAILVCHILYGIRADALSGRPRDDLIIKAGLLFVLGTAAFSATLSMARPGIGKYANGWLWVALIAAFFPAYALYLAIAGQFPMWVLYASSGIRCFVTSLAFGITIAAGLIIWLRTAAPVRPHRIGWSVGVSSGAFATMAYSLTCPSYGIAYAGVWYTLAIMTTAVICRLCVPRLIRW
jgi:hypothetical protein